VWKGLGVSVAPGLKKILDLIKSAPTDERLLDRYLSLAGELPNLERGDAMIQVTRILIPKMPTKALELAWNLFRSGQLEQEALAAMASVLEALGKSGKAAALRVDAMHITSHPSGSRENEEARRRIDTTVSLIQGGTKKQFLVDSATATNNKPSASRFSEPASREIPSDPPLTKKPESADKNVEAAHTSHMPVAMTMDLAADSTSELNQAQFDLDAQSGLVSDGAASTEAGIPTAIPRKEPSRHSKAVMERLVQTQASVATDSRPFDFQPGPQYPSPLDSEACQQYVKELVLGNKWSEILAFFDATFESLENPLLLTLFEDHKLTKIDIQFAQLWIDILIANHQERRALRLIHQTLIDEPHLTWAKMLRPRVERIIERLCLGNLDWNEADGVMSLRKKIAILRPKTFVYPIGFLAYQDA
jgi:hypothetical protein